LSRFPFHARPNGVTADPQAGSQLVRQLGDDQLVVSIWRCRRLLKGAGQVRYPTRIL